MQHVCGRSATVAALIGICSFIFFGRGVVCNTFSVVLFSGEACVHRVCGGSATVTAFLCICSFICWAAHCMQYVCGESATVTALIGTSSFIFSGEAMYAARLRW